jgi:hypothetical protein
MSPELENKLYEDFPLLFANRENQQSPMAFGCEHGDGWHGILRAACKLIDTHTNRRTQDGVTCDVFMLETKPSFHFTQIKEKFGTIRLYHDGGDSYCDGVVDMAEAMSAVTCERCGAPGKPNDSGWISTLCEACRK